MRIGVIEVGHWHSRDYYVRAIQLGAEIVGVSDQNAETAQRRADEIGCRAYTDYAELLRKEKPEFVFAHGIHCEMTDIADALVEHGTPFVMEKPMGVDWRRLAAVADKAEQKGLFAGADLQFRCYGLSRELLRLKETGELGRVTACSQRILAGKPQRYRDWDVPWVLDPAKAGGGPLFNFGNHLIDLFMLFSGEDVESVFCKSSGALHGLDIEDYSTVILSGSAGAVGTIEVGYVCPEQLNEQSLNLCTDQLFVSADGRKAATICFRDGRNLDVPGKNEGTCLDYAAETLQRVEAGDEPVATIRDMVRVLRVINAAVESAATNKPVTL